MFNTGAEVRCYNSNDKWITNRSISVNKLIPIPLFNTGAEVRCYNSNDKWITNISISVNQLIPHHCLTLDLMSGASIQTTSGSPTDHISVNQLILTPLFNTGAEARC
jgi:hypothetical protein